MSTPVSFKRVDIDMSCILPSEVISLSLNPKNTDDSDDPDDSDDSDDSDDPDDSDNLGDWAFILCYRSKQ